MNSMTIKSISHCQYGYGCHQRFSTSSMYRMKNSDSKRKVVKGRICSETDRILASPSRCFFANSMSSRKFSSDLKSDSAETQTKTVISDEYVPFQDRKQIIQDVIEQQWNPLPEQKEEPMMTFPINLERGKQGVFELDELVELLKSENAEDLCVIALPREIKYADHMVIVTARSPKHMLALGTFVRKRFKMKDLKRTDIIPKLEGQKTSKDWVALDLGNMVLHIFCYDAREYYDLETLWTVGPQFDDLVNEKDSEIVQLLNLPFLQDSTKKH